MQKEIIIFLLFFFSFLHYFEMTFAIPPSIYIPTEIHSRSQNFQIFNFIFNPFVLVDHLMCGADNLDSLMEIAGNFGSFLRREASENKKLREAIRWHFLPALWPFWNGTQLAKKNAIYRKSSNKKLKGLLYFYKIF